MEWYGMFIIFVPVYLFLAVPMRMVLIGETTGFLRAAGTIHWGAMIAIFSIGHIAYLLVLPASVNPNGAGPALVLFRRGPHPAERRRPVHVGEGVRSREGRADRESQQDVARADRRRRARRLRSPCCCSECSPRFGCMRRPRPGS